MAKTLYDEVRHPQIAGSFVAGYRPPGWGEDALRVRELLFVFPDNVLLIGTGGGHYTELTFGGQGSAAPQVFPINGAASITAPHGKPYTPEVWLVDANGDLGETDVHHSAGAVTLVFAQPFTGTLFVR